jgi:deoxyribodipyrimidine photo-lyase
VFDNFRLGCRGAQSVESFLEELVVRRELSDNYCFYNPQYDDIATSYDWVKETLQVGLPTELNPR